MDNLTERGPQDRSRISLSEDWEVKWWTTSLAISVHELKRIVAKVGNSALKVKQYLQNNR